MIGSVSQRPRFGIAVVTTDDVKSLQNDCDGDAIDEHKFEWANEKRIAAEITDKSIQQHPAEDVARRIKEPYRPIVIAYLRQNP